MDLLHPLKNQNLAKVVVHSHMETISWNWVASRPFEKIYYIHSPLPRLFPLVSLTLRPFYLSSVTVLDCYSLPTKGENKVTACLMKHIPMCLIFKVCLCPENNVKILFWSNSSRLHLLILSSDLWSHFSFKSWPRSLDSTV